MADFKDEWILDVPREWMTKFNGFTMDSGGSVMKIVYRHKDDWAELKDSDKGRLRFMSFSRVDRQQALNVLEERCHVTGKGNGDAATIFTTGVGSFQFSSSIGEKFNAKIENLTEFDVFVKALMVLTQNLPMEQLLYPECTKEEETIRAFAKEMCGTLTDDAFEGYSSHAYTTGPVGKLFDRELGVMETGIVNPDDIFPCILAMMGSGFGFMEVQKDGSFKLIDIMMRGGRCFVGMGSLMTGAKTYDELTSLAAQGNPYNVHTTVTDVAQEAQAAGDEGAGVYQRVTEFKEEQCAYSMGKAMGRDRDEFSKEDIAAAHLQTVATDICQLLQKIHQELKFKRVFWCGSFIKAEVVRKYITLEWRRRAVYAGMMQGKCEWVTSQFLKHGPYLGALGCVINSVDQFLIPSSEVAAEKAKQAEAAKA